MMQDAVLEWLYSHSAEETEAIKQAKMIALAATIRDGKIYEKAGLVLSIPEKI